MLMISATKAYSKYGGDKEGTTPIYRERRNQIRHLMPNLKGYELKKHIEILNDEINGLKSEIAECKTAINELRQGKDPEALRRKFNILYPMSARPEEIIERFKFQIEWRKKVAYWVFRERRIFDFESRKRRLASVKLQVLKRQRASLNRQAYDLLCQMKVVSHELCRLREAYQKTCAEHYSVMLEIEKLSFEEPTVAVERLWTGFKIPSEAIKTLNESLKDVELKEKGKGPFHKLFKKRLK